jgi:hypothetical protein
MFYHILIFMMCTIFFLLETPLIIILFLLFTLSLTNLEEQWKKWIEEHLSHEQTLTNCLIVAAYICYCGPFERDLRQKLCSKITELCAEHAIPREPQLIFKVIIVIVCYCLVLTALDSEIYISIDKIGDKPC